MNELEFTCTQKKSSYDDGWNHPKAMEEATDENGNLILCCECDCDEDCCQCEEQCTSCGEENEINELPDSNRLLCYIYEKTWSCDESHGPNNVNDEVGYKKHSSTTVKIVRKYAPINKAKD